MCGKTQSTQYSLKNEQSSECYSMILKSILKNTYKMTYLTKKIEKLQEKSKFWIFV